MMGLTTQAGVVELMKSSASEAQWNANCDKVEATNGGYPDFWFRAIVLSGLAQEVAAGWGGNATIKIGSL